MNEKGNFSSSEELNYEMLLPVYQEAFSGDPWYEVTKCADEERTKRCEGGFSRLALGELCTLCGKCPTRPAYEIDELRSKFDDLGTRLQMRGYTESVGPDVALAALVWSATPETIAEERYSDNAEMAEWIKSAPNLGDGEVMWLDEIFANKNVRSSGNLKNFESMVRGFAESFNTRVMAFRTINERLISGAVKSFGDQVEVLKRYEDVCDRRDFVIITLRGEGEEE